MKPTYYVNDRYSVKKVYISPGDRTLPMIVCTQWEGWDRVRIRIERFPRVKTYKDRSALFAPGVLQRIDEWLTVIDSLQSCKTIQDVIFCIENMPLLVVVDDEVYTFERKERK